MGHWQTHGTCVSLVKQLTLASPLNTTVKNDHVIDENTNQQQNTRIFFFKGVDTLTIFAKTLVAFDK
jgi:hypothetical protein